MRALLIRPAGDAYAEYKARKMIFSDARRDLHDLRGAIRRKSLRMPDMQVVDLLGTIEHNLLPTREYLSLAGDVCERFASRFDVFLVHVSYARILSARLLNSRDPQRLVSVSASEVARALRKKLTKAEIRGVPAEIRGVPAEEPYVKLPRSGYYTIKIEK